MVVCSKAPVGSCCTEDRTGHPAWKWSNSQVTTGPSCQDARNAFCMSKGTAGSKYCPSPSTRPIAQKPQCGKMFANRGFTCCCGGQVGCGPSGYTFTANRQDCCNKYGKGGGKCFNEPTPAPLPSRFPRGGPGPMPSTSAFPQRKAVLPSRFPGGPRTSPTYPQYTDTNPKVTNFPGGQRTVYKPISPTLPQTSGTLTPTSPDQAAQISRRYKNRPTPYPSGDGAGGAPPAGSPGDAPPEQPAAGGIVDKLCPYFKWVPVGGTDCNMQVLAGVAIVGLGGALLIKMLKGR
jgi:hypothetical protein